MRFTSFALLILSILFISCIEKSTDDLIIGKWILDIEALKKESHVSNDKLPSEINIIFYKDKTYLIERIYDGHKPDKSNGAYSFLHDKTHLILHSNTEYSYDPKKRTEIDAENQVIEELTEKILKLKGEDSETRLMFRKFK